MRRELKVQVFNPVTIGSKGPAPSDLDANGYVNQHGLSRKVCSLRPLLPHTAREWILMQQHIFDSVQASLQRLQLDYVDVLQCHRFDPDTPIEETMQALHDVVQKGWVRYIGMSSCFAYQFHAMQSESS